MNFAARWASVSRDGSCGSRSRHVDFVADTALRVWFRHLLIRIARVSVPDEAVGVRFRFWRSGRLRGEVRGAIGAVGKRPVIRILAANKSRGNAFTGESAEAVASLCDGDFEEAERVTSSSSSFSASSSASFSRFLVGVGVMVFAFVVLIFRGGGIAPRCLI